MTFLVRSCIWIGQFIVADIAKDAAFSFAKKTIKERKTKNEQWKEDDQGDE